MRASGSQARTDATASHEDGAFVARRTIAARDASMLSFTIVDRPGNTVLNGGPFVGMGDRLDAGQVGAHSATRWRSPGG